MLTRFYLAQPSNARILPRTNKGRRNQGRVNIRAPRAIPPLRGTPVPGQSAPPSQPAPQENQEVAAEDSRSNPGVKETSASGDDRGRVVTPPGNTNTQDAPVPPPSTPDRRLQTLLPSRPSPNSASVSRGATPSVGDADDQPATPGGRSGTTAANNTATPGDSSDEKSPLFTPPEQTPQRTAAASSDDSGSLFIPSPENERHTADTSGDDSDEESLSIQVGDREEVPIVVGENDDSGDDTPVRPAKRKRLVRGFASAARRSASQEPETPLQQRANTPDDIYSRMKRGRRQQALADKKEGKRSAPTYDPDPDFPALDKFPDDPSFEEERQAREESPENSHGSDSMDDFIVDDSEGSQGESYEDMEEAMELTPPRFGLSLRKDLKGFFREAIEWLVLLKINPGFAEKKSDLYMMAWDKLEKECSFANSSFISSTWKQEFVRTLRARPEMTLAEVPQGGGSNAPGCTACNRRGGPAKWMVSFRGRPYYMSSNHDFYLEDMDYSSGSDSSDDSADEDSNPATPSQSQSRGSQQRAGAARLGPRNEQIGNIAREGERWYLGPKCKEYVKNAHPLLHWNRKLRTMVEAQLEADGHITLADVMAHSGLQETQKYELVNHIMTTWAEKGITEDFFTKFNRDLKIAKSAVESSASRRRQYD